MIRGAASGPEQAQPEFRARADLERGQRDVTMKQFALIFASCAGQILCRYV